jgi:membrane protease YdiL (CAAX protease family)
VSEEEIEVIGKMNRRATLVLVGFITLLACLFLVATYFGVSIQPLTALSITLLLAPYWAFGFGLDIWLQQHIRGHLTKTFAPLLLVAPYLLFTIPRHQFRWDMCVGMVAIVLAISLLLHRADTVSKGTPDWHDWLGLALLGLSVDLHFFDQAWPVAGLTGIPKLLFVDAGLYGYLVIRPIRGIGFTFRMNRTDIRIGLREFLYFTPIAIVLGLSLRFLHFHPTLGNALAFPADWVFTLFFVAMPEELFFRGLMLNMLERRIGTNRALAVTSLLFGLAHFNKRARYFNWRYVILAAIAGVFYGRAWLARRRLTSSAITHATVDTVWSIWFR